MISSESPNDTNIAITLRKSLNSIEDTIADWFAEHEIIAIEGSEPTTQYLLEGENTILKRLMRVWLMATEKEYNTDERHKLIRLTKKMLDGVEAETNK